MTASRTALYRFFDADGDLLYVGISVAPWARWKQHKGEKDWAEEVATSTMEWFDTRPAAMAAEKAAIIAEEPRYNVVHATTQATPPAAVTALADIELEYECYHCQTPIKGKRSGYLSCDIEEAIHLRRRLNNHVALNWDYAEADDLVASYFQWAPQPNFRMGGDWRPYHDSCRKRPRIDATEFPTSREIDVLDIPTLGELIEAGRAMSGMDWFIYTNWQELIESAITGSGHVSPRYEGVAVERAIESLTEKRLSAFWSTQARTGA